MINSHPSKTSIGSIIVLIFSLVMLFSVESIRSNELLLGTDKAGTISHYAGRVICRAINRSPGDTTCMVVPAPNSTHNLTNIQSGALDLALVSSKLIHEAVNSSGRFQFLDIPFDSLRYIMPFYRLPVSLIVRRDAKIKSFQDLPKKRVNSGGSFSINKHLFEELMAAMGWQESTFRIYQSLPAIHAQDYIAFNNGTVQAMLHVGVHPDSKLERELKHSGARIVGIDAPAIKKLIASKSGFYGCSVPAGTYYPGFGKVKTLAIETQLITSEDLDESTIGLVMDAIFKAKRQIREAHPSFLDSGMSFNESSSESLVAHQAVGKYYK